jgi:hypothetical protein
MVFITVLLKYESSYCYFHRELGSMVLTIPILIYTRIYGKWFLYDAT